MAERAVDGAGEARSLVLEQRFAVIPEWVIDADVSDCAYRLYSVLLRYGQSSGCRMPSRATLAARLHKASKDTVDRALRELVAAGAVVVEHRSRDGQHLTNRYHLMATSPRSRHGDQVGGSRTSAATPGGPIPAATGSRTTAARVAAPVRPDPESLTQRNPPPDPRPQPGAPAEPPASPGSVRSEDRSQPDAALLAACQDLDCVCRALLFTGRVPFARAVSDARVVNATVDYVPHTAIDLYRTLAALRNQSW